MHFVIDIFYLIYFRQKSVDSEKNPVQPIVEKQAKLIEIEKAETGSVRLLIMIYKQF